MSERLPIEHDEPDTVLRPASRTPRQPAPRQSSNGLACLIAIMLFVSIIVLGVACLEMVSGGRFLGWVESFFWAFLRWPMLFLFPVIVVACARQRNRR